MKTNISVIVVITVSFMGPHCESFVPPREPIVGLMIKRFGSSVILGFQHLEYQYLLLWSTGVWIHLKNLSHRFWTQPFLCIITLHVALVLAFKGVTPSSLWIKGDEQFVFYTIKLSTNH